MVDALPDSSRWMVSRDLQRLDAARQMVVARLVAGYPQGTRESILAAPLEIKFYEDPSWSDLAALIADFKPQPAA